MNDKKRFLAFDFGADSGRAIVGTYCKERLSLEEIHRFPTGGTYVNGHWLWNILEFYSRIIEGLKKYVLIYGNQLDGIGIDTWGCDFGLIDKNGNLLGNPYTYRDPKNKITPEIIDKKITLKRMYELTGIQMLQFNTVNQLISLIEIDDPMVTNADKLLFIGDLLNYFLTGKKTSEFTIASISQLYNPIIKDWDKKIFDTFGIPEKIASQVISSGTVIGMLRAEIAAETGLGNVPVIAPAVHDTASAEVAVPTVENDEWAFISSGTWSIVGLELEYPIINDESFNMNVSNSGGAFGQNLYLKNIMGNWIIQSCKRIWNKKGINISYADIDRMVLQTKPFTAFIDPDDAMFLNPDNMIETVISYLDKTAQKSVNANEVGTICRIVYESLAYKYRYTLDELKKVTGKDIKVLYMLGGGSQNKMLNQSTANSLGIRVFAGPVEATAIGNIMMQLYGVGICSSLQEIRKIVKRSFEISCFFPEAQTEWELNYHRFLSIINKT